MLKAEAGRRGLEFAGANWRPYSALPLSGLSLGREFFVILALVVAAGSILAAEPPASAQTPATTTKPRPAGGRIVTIGNGSGMLEYPHAQETLQLKPGDTLSIAAGTYAGLALGNLSGTAESPITVRCAPQTTFTHPGGGDHGFANIAHLRFENFRIHQGGTWVITGASHDLLFKNFKITQSRRWSFRPYDRTKVFDGTKPSAFYNFRWEDCTFGNDGAPMHGDAISSSDWEPVSNMKSVALDFEVSHCTFQNYDFGGGAGSVISLARAFNLQVHDCVFSNIGVSKLVIGHDVVIGGAGYFKI